MALLRPDGTNKENLPQFGTPHLLGGKDTAGAANDTVSLAHLSGTQGKALANFMNGAAVTCQSSCNKVSGGQVALGPQVDTKSHGRNMDGQPATATRDPGHECDLTSISNDERTGSGTTLNTALLGLAANAEVSCYFPTSG